MRIPNSTYRVQFNREFRFTDALRIVDYLHNLGITDLYTSPILKARAGSTHGYDVTDPTQLNPEIGTPEEFDALCQALKAKGMGLIVDIVPNHMAASVENPWWFDILENGESSRYAQFFDVDWKTKKVLLPILGKPYGEALDNEELVLKVENGQLVLYYAEIKLPIAAGAEELEPHSIDRVLSRQHYRLAHWRKASDSINYRRFFDISDLVGIRPERDEVFHATHEYILKLVAEGKVTGIRVDHIDGLLDPAGYLQRLPDTYAVVEKILAGNEQLPCAWKTQGTTGYDFLNFTNAMFIAPIGFHRLERVYGEVTGSTKTFTEVFRERKRQVIQQLFAGELNALVLRLTALAEDDRHARDLRTDELKDAFINVTATLPVYRTYISSERISETDRALIEDAIAVSGRGLAHDFLRRVLLIEPAWYIQHRKPDYLDFVQHWQQFTGPVMAKGLEDTTFYVHNPLISVNEVGGDSNGPDTYFGVEQFHRRNEARRSRWPHTMNASSTHDTKRSEDVRARINVLTEVPNEWARCLRRWVRLNPTNTAPDANEQCMIYQSMLGAWPIPPHRLKQYATKALREAKVHTSWIETNEEYEHRVDAFIDSLYSTKSFLKTFEELQRKVAYFGMLSSLSQLVLKLTSPGIPDFYQGTEMWDLSLADPDNRRPIDFAARSAALAELNNASLADLLEHWHDGRLKLWVASKMLRFRRGHAALFSEGEYHPIPVQGLQAKHVVAFARHLHGQWCVVAVPRLFASLTRVGSPPLGKKVWGDTRIELPGSMVGSGIDVLTGEDASSSLAANLFMKLPVSVASYG